MRSLSLECSGRDRNTAGEHVLPAWDDIETRLNWNRFQIVIDARASLARTDSGTSTVSMTNTRYHAIGDTLFIGFQSGNITQSNNTSY